MNKYASIIFMLLLITTLLFSLSSCVPEVLEILTINTPTIAPSEDGMIYPTSTRPIVLATCTITPIETPYPIPYPIPELPAITQNSHSVPELLADTCKINTGKENGMLNLRACAGDTCNIIAILHEGDELIILDAGTWLHVLANDIAGYVLGRYCK